MSMNRISKTGTVMSITNTAQTVYCSHMKSVFTSSTCILLPKSLFIAVTLTLQQYPIVLFYTQVKQTAAHSHFLKAS